MATIYPGNIPSLEQLKAGDKVRFANKLTEQDPNIQKLFSQNAATWDVDPTTNKNIGITVQKPYQLPGTIAMPPNNIPASNSDYWGINPNAQDPLTYNPNPTGGVDNTTFGGNNQAYQDLLRLINPTPASTNYDPTTDPNVQRLIDNAQNDYIASTGTISNDYNSLRQSEYDAGGRATGSLMRLLGRAGGFTTTAGAQALTTQANTIDATINRLNKAQVDALAAAKNALNKGKTDILSKAKTDFDNLQKELETARQARAANLMKLMEMQKADQPKYEYNNDTGAYEYVSPDGQLKSIQVGTQKDLDPSNHFNSNGVEYVWSNKEQKYVASGGEAKIEHSTAYKEWQDYKLSGGKLDFNAYQNMDANRKRASGSLVNIYNQKSTYDGGTIPKNLKTDLLNDINVNKRTKEEVMAAYPEIDTAYIESLYPKSGVTNPFAN